MLQRMIENKIRDGFRQISSGDFAPVLAQFSPSIHFSFMGNHAMGGEFHRRDTVQQWFERFHRLFPTLKIEARKVRVLGLPWNITAVTNFEVNYTLPDGTPYRNAGLQILRIQWGKIVEDHLTEDTQVLTGALDRLSALGVSEAKASPLRD